MRKTLLASATAALMLAAGAASAQSISHDVQLEVLVETSCAFTVAENYVGSQIDGFSAIDGGISAANGASAQGSMTIACNTGMPYTIETNADANGLLTLTGQNTGGTIPARIFQGGDNTTVFGSVANGEEWSGVGNGDLQDMTYVVYFNDDGSEQYLPVPAVDTYGTVLSLTASF